MNTEKDEFRQFALSVLTIHQKELSVKYNNEEPASGLIEEAFKIHQKMLNDELDKKISDMLKGEDPWIKNELETLKGQYLSKLKIP